MLVVKVGGGEGVDFDAVCDDVASVAAAGERVVLVHGGSHATNVLSAALGHPPRFVTSPSGHTSRLTDRRTLEIFAMACAGDVNTGVVERLQRRGVRAVGLSGLDGRVWEGHRKSAIRVVDGDRVRVVRDDWTGVVERVNTRLLGCLLDDGYVPVLSPPAASLDGEAINVDADRAAAATAAALAASELVVLTNVPGLLARFPDEASLVRRVERPELEAAEALAGGRMRKKLLAAREALDGGVARVVLAASRVDRPVARARAGEGTVIE